MTVTYRTLSSRKAAVSASQIKPLLPEAFNAARPQLFPVLRIEASPQLLASRQIRFLEETDDLDDYRVSRFQIDGVLALLQRYASAERNQLHLFVDMKGCLATGRSPGEVSRRMLDALGLGVVPVVWTNPGLESQFTEGLRKTRRARAKANIAAPARLTRASVSVRSKEKKPGPRAKTAVPAHSY